MTFDQRIAETDAILPVPVRHLPERFKKNILANLNEIEQ